MSVVKTMTMIAVALIYVNTASAQSPVVFGFDTDAAVDALDGQIDAGFTVDGVTLFAGGVGPDFSDGASPGSQIGLETSISLNFDGDPVLLAIDNQTIGDNQFNDQFGDSNEDAFISFNEILNISFDTDVNITAIDFFGISGTVANTEVVTAIVEGGESFDFPNATGDVFTDPFGTGIIAAGTNISFSVANDPDDTDGIANFGITSISVSTAVPEPSSLVLLGLVGGLSMARRRRVRG